MNMDNLKACRICLSTDRFLHTVCDTDIRLFYSHLTGMAFQSEEGKPQRLCFECLHYLKSNKYFREKCLRTESVLNELLTNNAIKHDDLVSATTKYKLKSQLCTSGININTEINLNDTIIKVEEEPTNRLENTDQTKINVKTEYDNDLAIPNANLGSDSEEDIIRLDQRDVMVSEINNIIDDDWTISNGQYNSRLNMKSENIAWNVNNYKNISIQEFNENVKKIETNYKTSMKKCGELYEKQIEGPAFIEIDNKLNLMKSVEDNSGNELNNPSYQCDYCQKIFKHKAHLTVHIMSYRVKKSNCHSPSTANVSVSKKIKHNRAGEQKIAHKDKKQYECKVCNYKTEIKCNYTRHSKIHTGEKPFTCDFCPFRSARKYHIKTHILTHTGEKPFACNFCQYKSTHKGNLNTHMLIHTGEKPFACKLCSFKSARKINLNIHMLKHTGEKPFECEFCLFKCAHKSYLKSHLLQHTNEKV